ncbi:type VII secretion protein EsaA [Amphibacillus sp. MSJ-3]|uniref:type VII secretion protein EsaA n=1 Tax=Amphibacillus sp. MSJ-3 TaxID=2841505 RepID=UPI001C0E8F12|nr:type VII secretion protein EsaA [Amphibacillus sp. MSJ-3]MBU5594932.1 type VII secretion protein EsaA [Amphibacillus sp. MSJ-3]
MLREMIKIIVAVLIVLFIPLSYFLIIGDNPFQEKENLTQSIAVVNEDNGIATEDNEIRLGEQVINLFEDESSFDWLVVSRSAAESGLQSQNFDAIIYIPSDFSQNVMAYDESNPTKVIFDYRIQEQLNTSNSQRVQGEVERVVNRTNNSITELYWYYVSTDMEVVRKQFDRILATELEFQEAMLAFYQPSSEDLTTQIIKQQSMIHQLQSSIEETNEKQTDYENLIDQVTGQLTAFIDFVNKFEDYQEQQQKLLSDVQSDAIVQIDRATDNQLQRSQQEQHLLSDHQSKTIGDMGTLAENIEKSKEVFTNLKTYRYRRLSNQAEDYLIYQNRLLDYYQQLVDTTVLNRYQDEIIELRTVLGADEQLLILNPPDQNPIFGIDEDKERESEQEMLLEGNIERAHDDQSDESAQLPSFEAELTMLEELEGQIREMLAALENESEPLSAFLLELQDHLVALFADVQNIQTTLEDKDEQQERSRWLIIQQIEELTMNNQDLMTELSAVSELEEVLREENLRFKEYAENLLDVNEQLRDQLDHYVSGLTKIIEEVEAKEKAILDSEQLSNRRRKVLTTSFETPLYTGQIIDLLNYYAYLDQYESVLIRMGRENQVKQLVMNDECFTDQINHILRVTNREEAYWNTLSDDLPTTKDGLLALEDKFTLFMTDYQKTIQDSHDDLLESLVEVKTDAVKVLQQIQQPDLQLGNIPKAETGVSHDRIMQNQIQLNDQFGSIRDWLGRTEESQSIIVDYTDDLQREVASVQSNADILNERWSSNVETTRLVRDDVFSVLGNTFIDGQSNDDVYDFLTNPLELKNSTMTQNHVIQVPPVVILFGVLLGSLLIGYLSYYFTSIPIWLRTVLFIFLNIIVGFAISIFGLNIYQLVESNMAQWTIYTILLLFVCSGIVTVSYTLHRLFGWLITVGMIVFFVTPLIALTTPNFNFIDPMSRVYMSIQYSGRSAFPMTVIILTIMLGILIALQISIEYHRSKSLKEGLANEQVA